jgi:hypothetical protein
MLSNQELKKTLMKKLASYAGITFLAINLSATQYYVDSETGSSSNDGSLTAPWDSLRTVSINSSSFKFNDIINFKRGQRFYSFFNGNLFCSGKSGRPITFQSYGDTSAPAPVLSVGKRIDQDSTWTDLGDGRYLYTGYTGSVTAYIWEDGFPVKKATSSALTDGYWFLSTGTGIYIRPTDGQSYSTHEFYLANNGIIFGITNCGYLKFKDLAFEYSNTAIYNGISATSTSSGIEVVNCSFYRMNSGIRLNSPSTSLENHDITVTDNIFTDIRFAFICTGLNGAARHYNLNISNNIINNICIDGAYALADTSPDVEALSFQNLHDSVISGNIIKHGVKESENITDVQNELLASNGIVIWVHPDALIKNVQITDNVISDVSRAIALGAGIGYFLEDNVVKRNIIDNCEMGLRFNSSSYSGNETIVEANELYSNKINICLYSGARGYSLTNNISFSPEMYHVQLFQYWQLTDSYFDNNIYSPDGALWRYEGTSTTYSDFAAWQNSGLDDNSLIFDENNMILWLKSDAGTLNGDGLPAEDNEGVQTWQDQTGNNWDFSCTASTRRPTLADASAPNGTAKGLYFDGIYNTMRLTDKSAAIKSFYIAFKNTNEITSTSTQEVLIDTGLNEELVLGSCTSLINDEIFTVFSQNSSTSNCRSAYASTTATIPSSFHILAVIYNQTSSGFDIYLDGNLVNNASSGTDDTPLLLNETIYIGSRNLAGSYFKGYVFECIAYDSAHDQNQMDAVTNYITIKYNQ